MLSQLTEKILAGDEVSFAEALSLTDLPADQAYELIHAAWRITRKFARPGVELCSIINARSGHCPEDCRFCAQSGRYRTDIQTYPLLAESRVLEPAREMESLGVKRFSLVISGRGPSRSDFPEVLKILRALKRETGLTLCASLGIIDPEQAEQLAAAGVTTYHHNLETSRSHFPSVCTTHSYQERIDTIRAARSAGLEICCGGILFIGESWKDRVEFAFELKELGVDSVPLNILTPIKGTPLENLEPANPLEVLKAITIFRIILPRAR
ncbi:MAG: biotin synthase BioB, partial [Syntrophomonadaceae bacterium]|nr:biotin synthase BioB [Syntrophomonadaceae bacterium]